MSPVLIVIAGPNGAGKTTVTRKLRKDHWSDSVEYLNADDVAQERFGDWNSPSSVLAAAQWTDKRREELLSAGKGIAFETVLSTESKLLYVARARAAGYFVRAFFVGTDSPTINAARVARRFIDGGHTVPIDKIVQRYGRSLINLQTLIALAHRTYVFDNSIDGQEARLCARTIDGQLRKTYGQMPTWATSALLNIAQHPDFQGVG